MSLSLLKNAGAHHCWGCLSINYVLCLSSVRRPIWPSLLPRLFSFSPFSFLPSPFSFSPFSFYQLLKLLAGGGRGRGGGVGRGKKGGTNTCTQGAGGARCCACFCVLRRVSSFPRLVSLSCFVFFLPFSRLQFSFHSSLSCCFVCLFGCMFVCLLLLSKGSESGRVPDKFLPFSLSFHSPFACLPHTQTTTHTHTTKLL